MAVIEAISTTYLEADAATVTFSSIPATYEHLQLRCSIRTSASNRASVTLVFNGDTGTNYTSHRILGAASSVSAGGWSGLAGLMGVEGTGGDSTAADYGVVVADILDYANTNKNTTCQFISGAKIATGADLFVHSGLWDATAAVHTITLDGSYNSLRGSEFTLYGLKSS